jgi:hypothetical protein
MELNDTYPWRMANHLVLGFVVTCALVSVIPARPLWFGVLPSRQVELALSVLAGCCIHFLTKRYVRAIADYEPQTSIQAKRANEQIKFSANFGNTIAAAWISIMALSQLIKPEPPRYDAIALAIVISGLIHAGSRNMVALIKDENIPDTERTPQWTADGR